MEDEADYDITDDNLRDCFSFMRGCGEVSEPRTLVVCTGGTSRSATICIAYLMYYRSYSLKDAFSLVKAARSFIDPNPGFFAFLQKFEQRLINKAKL